MRVPPIIATVVGVLAEVVLAGAVIGGIEAARIMSHAESGFQLGTWAVLAALEGVGAIAIGVAMVALLAAVGRVPVISRWTADLRAGGEARVVAVWRVLLVVVGVVAATAAIYAIAKWVHVAYRLHEGEAVGLLLAAIVVPVVIGIALVMIVIERRVRPRLAGSARLADVVTRRGWMLAAIGAVIVAYGPALLVGRAVPALELDGLRALSLLVVFVVIARGARVGTRRPAQIAAGVAAIACVVGAWQLSAVERARALVSVHGVFGARVARAMWSLGDRDGDGYAGAAAGGADCDDDDAARHPGAAEIAGNGIDENCSGADVAVAALAERDTSPPVRYPNAPKHNIVVITVDALRADHLGAYGYHRPTSPAIDAFAATATQFTWAVTPCPATRCSMPALMTGRLPGVQGDGEGLLAVILRRAGWDTAAITSYFRFSQGTSSTDGFATVDGSADAIRLTRPGQSTADHVAEKALRWIGSRAADPRPYVLWLHFYDPHYPYEAHGDAGRFGDSDLDRYDAEIAYTDQQIGRVLAALDPRNTIVVLTSDHGEELRDHGMRFHGKNLYNSVVRVPLFVRYPGAVPQVVSTPVSLVDVAPTLIELVGVPRPAKLSVSGRSFARAIRDPGEPAARPLLLSLVPDSVIRRDMLGLLYGPWKVIWDREANAWSLYQFAADPEERRDHAAEQPATLQDMQRRLHETIDRELAKPASK